MMGKGVEVSAIFFRLRQSGEVSVGVGMMGKGVEVSAIFCGCGKAVTVGVGMMGKGVEVSAAAKR
jgi:hypothetical protein